MKDQESESKPTGHWVRHPDFARRLEQACDGSPDVPPLNYGRLKWFVERLAEHGIDFQKETVRRWFLGFSYPRKDTMAALAQILKVDVGWLSGGTQPAKIDVLQARRQVAVAGGAVNVVAGFMQFDGAHPAFPVEGDKDAEANQINLFAIIKGIKHNFYVAHLNDADEFEVPMGAEGNFILGVVRENKFSVQIFELDWETVAAKSTRKNVTYHVPREASEWREIESFSERL